MSEEKLRFSSRELNTYNRCTMRRKHGKISTKADKNEIYDKAVIIKQIIKNILNDKSFPSKTIIREKLKEGFKEMKFPSDETKKRAIEFATQEIYRYTTWEKRTPMFVDPLDIELFGVDVNISPDYIFLGDDYIEVVKLKISKPQLTNGGNVRDKSASQSLELYAMLKYAETYLDLYPDRQLKASYYYLRNEKDSYTKNEIVYDYYSKGNSKSIVTLSAEDEDEMKFRDSEFEKLFAEFIKGENNCNNCEYCDFYNICNYKNASKIVNEEKSHKKAADLVLTPTQNKAINFIKGLCRINAGAGAGKTLVVALRTVTLLLNGIKPEEICLLTFSDAGAFEMRERVRMYLEDFGEDDINVNDITIKTFNAFGNDIIIDKYDKFGYEKAPSIINEIKKKTIISKIIAESPVITGLDYYNFDVSLTICKGVLPTIIRALDVIKLYRLEKNETDMEFLVNKLWENRLAIKDMTFEKYEIVYDMYLKYNNTLKEMNLLEYADQELLLLKLLDTEPFFVEDFGYKHIIVDEFQDSSDIQIDIIKLLCDTPTFESLMVVGDDSQSIYSFRDTTPENILKFFEKMEQEGTDINLVENHRSTPEIIDLANKINNLNIHRVRKELIATREPGPKPTARGFRTSKEEYKYIAEQIDKKIKAGVKAEDIAFIARSRSELLAFGNELSIKGIPWILMSPEPLLENSRILAAIELAKSYRQPDATKGMLIYLNALYKNQLLERTDDEINNLINDLRELIIEKSSDKEFFIKMLEAIDDNDEIYQTFIDTITSEETLEDIIEYAYSFEKYGQNITGKRQLKYPGVILTTAHSSKGLEFPIVYNSVSKYDEKDRSSWKKVEENRRLLFVSLTRARDELHVTGKYYIGGTKKDRNWNNYLKEIYSILGQEFPLSDDQIV